MRVGDLKGETQPTKIAKKTCGREGRLVDYASYIRTQVGGKPQRQKRKVGEKERGWGAKMET